MRRSGWVAVVAVVGLGLSGCSDPGTPSDTLPTAASTSAEPTLEPLGPADFPVPAEAREQTEAGAEAMASYYLELINRVRSSLSSTYIGTGDMRSLAPNCSFCTQAADGFDGLSVEQVSVDGAATGPLDFGTMSITGNDAEVSIAMSRSAGRFYDASGGELTDRALDAALLTGGISLSWDAALQGWLVSSLNLSVA